MVSGCRIVTAQPMVHVAEPLTRLHRLERLSPLPPVERLNCHGVGDQLTLAPISIAGRCDRNTLLWGVEFCMLTKFSHKFFASRLQQLNVRLAVFNHLPFEIEDEGFVDACGVPCVEFVSLLLRHALGVVRGSRWHGSFIVLLVDGVKKMREESFV